MASSSSKKLANAQAASLAAQVANMAAQLDFQKERMRLLELPQFQHLSQMDIDKLAFEKSQATWENALKEATLTGTYQGQPTLQYLEQQAKLFGVVDGQQTLEGKLSDAQIAQINHAMQLQSHASLLEDQKFGFERERWGKEFDYQMEKDLRDFGITEAQLTGMYNGQQTLASKELDSKNTQAYLSLLGSLQGPGNAFKQMRVLGSTPQGLKDMVGQWTGKYEAAGLTGTGQAPGQANVSDLFNQSYGNAFMGQQQAGVPPPAGTPGVPPPAGTPGVPPPGGAPPPPTGPPGTIGAAGVATAGPQYGPYPGGQGQINGPSGRFDFNDARSYSEAVRLATGLPALLTSPPALNESPGYGPPAARDDVNVPLDPNRSQVYPIGQAPPPTAAQAAATAAQAGVAGAQAAAPAPPTLAPPTPTAPIEPGMVSAGGGGPIGDQGFAAYMAQFGVPQNEQAAQAQMQQKYAEWQAMTPEQRAPFEPATRKTALPTSNAQVNANLRYAGGIPQDATPPGQPLDDRTMTDMEFGADPGAAARKAAQGDQQGYWTLNEQTGQYEFTAAPAGGYMSQEMVTPQMPPMASTAAPTPPAPAAPAAPGVASTQQPGTPPPGEQGYTVSPAGTQAPIGAYNYESTPSGQTQVYPPGVTAPADSSQVSTSTPQSMSGNVGLLPSQINAENYENSNDYAKEFMWGYLENEGWDKMAAQSAYQKSLPRYAGPASGTVNAGLGF